MCYECWITDIIYIWVGVGGAGYLVIFSADWRTTGRKWIWQGKQISSDLLPRNSKNETDVAADIPVTKVSMVGG